MDDGAELAMKEGQAAERGAYGAGSYDKIYRRTPKYLRPWNRSHYLPLWEIIVGWLSSREKVRRPRILEPGCGPGQLAALLYARGFHRYHGFDFSPVAIEMAKRAAPQQSLVVADARDPAAYDAYDYNTVIMTEFLEHVDDDLAILRMLKPGARVMLSVPDNDTRTHVRFFPEPEDVVARYEEILDEIEIQTYGHWHAATGKTKCI